MKNLTGAITAFALASALGSGFYAAGDAAPASPDAKAPPAAAQIEAGSKAPSFKLKDSNGKEHSLADFKGKVIVLEWVNFGCPFVKKHYVSGNMQKLQKDYTKKGVVWLSVNSSAPGKQGHYDAAGASAQVKEQKAVPTAYLLDETGEVGRAYGAKTTPHMFVIDKDAKIVYAGAIDDHPSFDAAEIPKSINYVQQALDEVLAGKTVTKASTKAYGCSVKYQ